MAAGRKELMVFGKSRLSGSISMSSETGLKGGYKSSVQLLVVERLYLNCTGCNFLDEMEN